ncbi:MAG: TetR/AcrR family transcriptional regulator [bacterium]|nr:TetR/AcrR family transcriptional regulator [bacterium]
MSGPDRDRFGAVYRPRRRSESEERTEELLESAVEEFLERGYEGARISEIARRGGVTTGAIYARWRSKNDLLTAAVGHVLAQDLTEQRLQVLGAAEMQPHEMFLALGESLMAPFDLRDVMVQVFGSARNNESIRACLDRFLNEDAGQLGRLIDVAKEQGFCDPQLSTAALSLFCQAIGIGIDLLLTSGLDDHYRPAANDWSALIARVIDAVQPPKSVAPAV